MTMRVYTSLALWPIFLNQKTIFKSFRTTIQSQSSPLRILAVFRPLRARIFKSNHEVVKALEVRCKKLSGNGLSFVFQTWQELWPKCVKLERGYFKKEQNDLED